MDLIEIASGSVRYVASKAAGLSALILDDDTYHIVSMTTGWSIKPLFNQEIYYLDKLASDREAMPEVAAIVFCRPSASNLALLSEELRDPKYQAYHLIFTSFLDPMYLEQLAEADIQRLVSSVEEIPLDFYVYDSFLFSLECGACYGDSPEDFMPSALRRCTSGITSMLTSMKMSPCIRYQGSSPQCAKLAQLVAGQVGRGTSSDVLLILDRRDDMATPLLRQWTYHAMVHDFVGARYNRVVLPGTAADGKMTSFAPHRDEFLTRARFATFPQMLRMKRELQTKFQEQRQLQAGLSKGSLEDIKAFMSNYHSYEEVAHSFETHASLVSHIQDEYKNKFIHEDDFSLLETQAEILCEPLKRKAAWQQVSELCADRRLDDVDKLRLLAMYVVRFCDDRSTSIEEVLAHARRLRVPESHKKALERLMTGSSTRSPGVTGDLFKCIAKRLYQQESEAEMQCMQHTPLLADRLSSLEKGSLSTRDFPWCQQSGDSRPRRIVVFQIGGTTFEEAKLVYNFNHMTSGIEAVLGSSMIHNFETFMLDTS